MCFVFSLCFSVLKRSAYKRSSDKKLMKQNGEDIFVFVLASFVFLFSDSKNRHRHVCDMSHVPCSIPGFFFILSRLQIVGAKTKIHQKFSCGHSFTTVTVFTHKHFILLIKKYLIVTPFSFPFLGFLCSSCLFSLFCYNRQKYSQKLTRHPSDERDVSAL